MKAFILVSLFFSVACGAMADELTIEGVSNYCDKLLAWQKSNNIDTGAMNTDDRDLYSSCSLAKQRCILATKFDRMFNTQYNQFCTMLKNEVIVASNKVQKDAAERAKIEADTEKRNAEEAAAKKKAIADYAAESPQEKRKDFCFTLGTTYTDAIESLHMGLEPQVALLAGRHTTQIGIITEKQLKEIINDVYIDRLAIFMQVNPMESGMSVTAHCLRGDGSIERLK